jgi:hypothetical protein
MVQLTVKNIPRALPAFKLGISLASRLGLNQEPNNEQQRRDATVLARETRASEVSTCEQ